MKNNQVIMEILKLRKIIKKYISDKSFDDKSFEKLFIIATENLDKQFDKYIKLLKK